MWDAVEKLQYRTLNAAQLACERHYKKWKKIETCTTKTELLELVDHIPFGAPVWVSLAPKIKKLMRLDN